MTLQSRITLDRIQIANAVHLHSDRGVSQEHVTGTFAKSLERGHFLVVRLVHMASGDKWQSFFSCSNCFSLQDRTNIQNEPNLFRSRATRACRSIGHREASMPCMRSAMICTFICEVTSLKCTVRSGQSGSIEPLVRANCIICNLVYQVVG